MEKFGEQFLHQRDSKLHTTNKVEHEKERRIKKEEKISQKPADKIANWLDVVEKTHTGHRDDPRVLKRIKKYYHKEHVIKAEDFPESYFENQKRLAREEGHGDVEISNDQRGQLKEVIISDQESTLDNWADYLSSSDSDSFPMWAKYFVFNGMLKLSTFDKERHSFGKRKRDTVAPFPDLNREALAYVVDATVKKINKEEIEGIEDNQELQRLLQGVNFGKLYAYAIEKVTPTEQNELENTGGEWIKYDQNSDHMSLVKSLQGHGTGWCTAGETTAKNHLKGGDFYVYYSYDKEDKPTIPRAAIRMQENDIAEVRGIAPEQNLDPYIGDVVDGKLNGFPDGEQYKKKTADMKRLTEIEKKHASQEELTKEDLNFLYEMDSNIEGFGYHKDPRIEEVKDKRETKKDLSYLTGHAEDQISTTKTEALSENIRYHYGNLDLNSLTSAEGLNLPETIRGSLALNGLTSAEGLNLPETIRGSLTLNGLTSAEGLNLPKTIEGHLNLSGLISAEGLNLPETIRGGLTLRGLTSAEGLNLPKTIEIDLDLSGLTSAEGLNLPKTIEGYLNLRGLISAEGLNLPETIGGDLILRSLTSAEGLNLPEAIGGYLNLRSLTSAEGLNLTGIIKKEVDLGHLNSDEKQEIRVNYPHFKIE